MPDIHYGYGLPIGGVIACDVDTGVVSPGGVGYDINCGVRLLKSNVELAQVQDRLRNLVDALANHIPHGVGSSGRIHLSHEDLDAVSTQGAAWAVHKGYGTAADLQHTEENGCYLGANPRGLSREARKRGLDQQGTLGSGNHFIEIQVVEEILDGPVAQIFGLQPNMITVMILSGSRGFGHQICADALKLMARAVKKYQIDLRDQQLACAPLQSPEGQAYLEQMKCAANYAWANRQCMTHFVREAFASVLQKTCNPLIMDLLYDVAHNIVKIENHVFQDSPVTVAVHRKGATRAFGPNRLEVPVPYRDVGQPILVPGDMGRASYILVGTQRAMTETFGSTCHGAGRVLSRAAAIRSVQGQSIELELQQYGIITRSASKKTLVEEMPKAYKDVSQVVHVVHGAGISRLVARLRPLAVVKG